ncbi:mycofactocin biosynthesis glycosyltransferase MftF [Actinomycetospora corticicola]|uniref:Mycofactocin system glycosyltransferase n=1 Tax=Actinomycetospora corticicola TaxID=663602 RepID=A0A7Y9E1N6_9PSEU|nr:mycofactocin biosynthesis glycosyltransferase MftF [Actinomycetospora corticicola]NYD39272.1 mycofactocin system glycosyltransferase [Actinomycetospora corticicola]
MSAPRLPDGWTVRPDPRTWRVDGGATWIGGSPPRVLRLSVAARKRLDGPELVVTDATSAALARLLSDAGVAHPVGGDGPTPDDVTVVVPVKDRSAELDRLLVAVRATAPGIGIVVVDDGSDDPGATSEVAERHGARVVRHRTSRGPSAGRNTGARACTTPLIAFLDSDVVPEPGWLDTLLGHLADPAVGVVAPRIVAFSDGGPENAVTRYERRRSSLDLGARPAPVTARSRVAYVPSAALVVRREAFGDGFDEAMPVAEDVDLVWRIAAAGWRLRYDPAARVAHEHRAHVRAWLARKAFYGTGAAPLARQHPRRVPPVALASWTAATVALLGVQRPWSSAAAGVVTLVATARLARGLRRPGEPWLRVTPSRQESVVAATGRQQRRFPATGVRVTGPVPLALVLAPWGLGGALWQAAGALTRHWWPVAAVGALVSRRVRRALLLAAVAEGLADWARFRDPGAGPLDALAHVAAHRADDLAYGAGLWWGAWRHRTVSPLLPDLSGKGPDA